jgi:hypothetical protein
MAGLPPAAVEPVAAGAAAGVSAAQASELPKPVAPPAVVVDATSVRLVLPRQTKPTPLAAVHSPLTKSSHPKDADCSSRVTALGVAGAVPACCRRAPTPRPVTFCTALCL